MIDSEVTDNFILQKAIEQLELTLQWVSKFIQVYMINEEYEWIYEEVHIKVIIRNDSQKLRLNVLKSVKYDAILEMSWLHKKNSQINWINKELYVTKNTYNVSKQLKKNLSEHKSWDHEISLLEKRKSKWMSLYLMSEDQLKKVWDYLAENLKREFIRLLKSSAEYSILFVSKKNDIKQLYVDYRQLNEITYWNSYFLLLIEELQDRLEKVKWFISLDLKKVYYHVCMKESKEWKMTFWMRYRHYEYIIMSFELKNVSVIFQRLINNILREYLNDFVITYLDDILIYSDNLKMHCKHMCKVLAKLNEQAMYVKKSKSRFKIKKIQFLKYVIWFNQIKKNLKKIKTVQNWSTL